MKIDGHVHTHFDDTYDSSMKMGEKFMEALHLAGMDGAVILSPDPENPKFLSAAERMSNTIDFCKDYDTLYPLYWINPLDEDALWQVDEAISRGFLGFKMICSNYFVDGKEAMAVLEKIASKGRPVLFHSGISWDGVNSANKNRPGNFEALLDIPKIKFTLAHMSWPWCDECFAVYGKMLNAYLTRPENCCEMFVDVTPGTPRAFREEVFRHMFGTEYEYRYNLIFGTDSSVENYNVSWAKEWQDRDNALYEKYAEGDIEDFKEHVYGKNILRFLGVSDEVPQKKIPTVAEGII